MPGGSKRFPSASKLWHSVEEVFDLEQLRNEIGDENYEFYLNVQISNLEADSRNEISADSSRNSCDDLTTSIATSTTSLSSTSCSSSSTSYEKDYDNDCFENDYDDDDIEQRNSEDVEQ